MGEREREDGSAGPSLCLVRLENRSQAIFR